MSPVSEVGLLRKLEVWWMIFPLLISVPPDLIRNCWLGNMNSIWSGINPFQFFASWESAQQREKNG